MKALEVLEQHVLHDKNIPSVTQDSVTGRTSTQLGGGSEAHKLHMEAEAAELDLQQARHQAALLKKEASLEMEKSQLKARILLEKAELAAKLTRGQAEISEAASKVGQTSQNQVDVNSKVESWLQQYPSGNVERSTQQRSIDGWIDLLIPGDETVLPADPTVFGGNDHLAACLVRLESERGLPEMELPIFNGSAKEWPRFIERFYQQVHQRPGIPDTRRMDILQSHLSREAQKLVQGIGFTGMCYAEALQELKRTFGHRNKVARAYINEVTSGTFLQPHNVSALRNFFVNVRDCIITLTRLDYTMDLQGSEILVRAARRLPTDKIGQWNRFVSKVSTTREPTLHDLKDWLQDTLTADSNPYAVQYDRKESALKEKVTNDKAPRKTTILNATTVENESKVKVATEPVRENKRTSSDNSWRSCSLCQGSHNIYRCRQFASKDANARREEVMKLKLCYNCLKPTHKVQDCPSHLRCREDDCGRKHHTLLHADTQAPSGPEPPASAPSESVALTSGDTASGVCNSARSPLHPGRHTYFQLVSVYAKGDNGVIVPTVAILDSGSQLTLIQESLAKDLGLNGEKRPLTIQTMNSEQTRESRCVSLKVVSNNPAIKKSLNIDRAWTVDKDSIQCGAQNLMPEWEHCRDVGIPESISAHDVQILTGMDNPDAHIQTEVRRGGEDEPLAVLTYLGWALMGVGLTAEQENGEVQAAVNFIKSQDQALHEQIQKFWDTESFGVRHHQQDPSSADDRNAMKKLEENTKHIDGHYQVPMLWKSNDVRFPDNRQMAKRRLDSLEKRFDREPDFKKLYVQTMNNYIEKGFARKMTSVEAKNTSAKTWYLPHFGVINPNKPGKVRIVFDAAASYKETSLNDNLVTGPDLLNNLLGVLQRFRLYEVTISADIEAMFHMVHVPPEDAEALLFFWKEDPDAPGPYQTYQMLVHIFGAADSPACASYALRRTGLDRIGDYPDEITSAMCRDFYMDDLHKSLDAVPQTIVFAKEVIELAAKGGFRLHKCTSNRQEVLDSIQESERALKEIDFELPEAPVQRTLGLKWNVREDVFFYACFPKNCIMTKRGVVSLASSIFDPIGFLTPFTMRAKLIIQFLWKSGLDWDEPLPEEYQEKWQTWLDELKALEALEIPRHHNHFTTKMSNVELHIFCDASEFAFGAAAYLHYEARGEIMVSFLGSKTHVAPLKTLSIPRLELQGAVLATRLAKLLQKELGIQLEKRVFWTDSTTVLQYLRNEQKRFKPFVANRITEILEDSEIGEWHYVPSAENSADFCTRGMKASDLQLNHMWFQGPGFLHQPEPSIEPVNLPELQMTDPELKTKQLVFNASMNTAGTDVAETFDVSQLLNPDDFSSWSKLTCRTAWISRAVRNFAACIPRFRQEPVKEVNLTAAEYAEAGLVWVRHAQQATFGEEFKCLRQGEPLDPRKSKIAPLEPYLDKCTQCLRVGGRLRNAQIPANVKHQLLLPKDHVITYLIANDLHVRLMHCGREHLISELRQMYWPLRIRSLARHVIARCVICRHRKAKPCTTKMADLPLCRVDAVKGPFYYTGVDYFGPLTVTLRRSSLKRWGCLFTCLSTRAVHLEVADSLETDSFIMCLRRFIGRRGHPREMWSDNGTNFKGAQAELKRCLDDMDQNKVLNHLSPLGISWHFNPPLAAHWGGAWERLVGSVKKALNAILGSSRLTDSVLHTALVEVEGVLNSRPLTHSSMDMKDLSALTPNHFLIGRSDNKIPPDSFQDREINSRKRWRQSQVVANQVCKRWLKEYLPNLTVRQKWMTTGQTVK